MPEANPLRSFRVAYALGIVLCVVWPLFLQVILRRAVQPMGPGGELAAELGYTFTGLSALSVIFVLRRSARMRKTFPSLDPSRQSQTILREVLLYSALFELSAVYGILYFALQGPYAERYGRTFIALPTVMFFLFVPRSLPKNLVE
jgi:hypothetical protein